MVFNSKSLILGLSSILLVSCGGQEVKQDPTPAPAAVIKPAVMTPQPVVKKDHPEWIDNPQLADHIGATGMAYLQKFGGTQAQYIAAIEDAQDNLKTAFKQYQQSLLSNNNPENNQAISDHNITKLVFENAIIKEEWTNPKTGTLHLWIVLPLKNTALDPELGR